MRDSLMVLCGVRLLGHATDSAQGNDGLVRMASRTPSATLCATCVRAAPATLCP
jgi:hypothetical protein